MWAKVLVLTVAAVAFGEDHGYRLNSVHEPTQDYRNHYEHIPVTVHGNQEYAREAHYSPAPESREHAYLSQSIVHHAGLGDYKESQESNEEHVAPVYQYSQEEEDEPIYHAAPVKHYQSLHYPASGAVHREHDPKHPAQSHSIQSHAANPHIKVQVHYAEPHYPHDHDEVRHHHMPQHHAAPVHEGSNHAAPIHYAHHADEHAHDSHDELVDYYAYPKYQYEYKIEDPHTGDNKFQHEYRDGDVVKGVYGLQEADGSYRTVEYSSDKHTGFNAIVKHSAPSHHVQIENHHNN